ncbi:MAG: glycosyltransferase [Treponema sp.]|nr:glycosyltransferase [Treponema sp.]
MENKILSVIVPVYNVEKYLNRAIDSILFQTFKDFELLLIDDGSTDMSSSICDDYAKKDSRIKVIHKKNCGVSDARNKGIENASGKWITFVDPDDYIDSTLYEEAFLATKENNADFVYWNCVTFGKGEDIAVYPISKGPIITEELTYLHGVVWRALYLRENIIKYDIKFPFGISYGEDMPFIYKSLAVSKRPWCIGSYSYHYFIRDDSASKKILSKKRCMFYIEMIHEVLDFLEENNKKESFIQIMNWRFESVKIAYLVEISDRKDFDFYRSLFPEIHVNNISVYNKFLNFSIVHRFDFIASFLCFIRKNYRKRRYGVHYEGI